MPRLILLLSALIGTLSLAAQDLFVVRVGTFRDVKVEEFAALRPLGFIYGIPQDGNTTDVFLGQYDTQNKAVTIATNLQGQGYRNAQAFSLPVGNSTPVTYIQFSLHSGSRPIEWDAMERAGQLFVISADGTTKILTGPYPTAQAAGAALPSVKALGYRDAFVKTLDPARLIRIGTFETGIKKPLIPIQLSDNPPVTQQPVPTPAATTPASTPVTYSPPAPASAPANYGNSAPSTPVSAAPAIDARTKRHSAAELQRALKEKGFYEGSIDGYYGPGTAAAYNQAWASLPELQKYRMLATMLPVNYLGAEWEETKVLLAVAEDMAAGTGNVERNERMVAQRPTLYTTNTPLASTAGTRVRNWAATVWANLDDWATEDPLHARIFSAFRISYHQTQVRLEDHYKQLGLGEVEARDMATAMLQNLIGAKLDRFL